MNLWISNYDQNHELYNTTNNKVIGKFKNVSPNNQIIEFIGLRSKLYSYVTDDNKQHKRCEGIKKCVKDKELEHNNYKTCLNNREELTKNQKIFKSLKHQVYIVKVHKIALSYNDDKCFIMDNNIDTLTHGHYKLEIIL